MKNASRRRILAGLSAIGVVSSYGTARAQTTPVAPVDPLSPQGLVSDQIVGPLAGISIRSATPDAFRRFLQGGMGMIASAPEALRGSALYGLGSDHVSVRTYSGPIGGPQSIVVRVIEGAVPETTQLRPGHDALLPGLMSIGFPVSAIEGRAKILAAYDFPAVSGVTDITLPRGDGSTYKVFESHHRGPDGVLALCIDRASLKPVGPIDLGGLGIGGPAYCGMIVTDAAAMERLLVSVFSWQKRRDVVLSSSGPNGGLGLPAGQRFIFQQYFAPGTDTGYLVVMQHLMNQRPVPNQFGLTQRGLGMLSFKTGRLNDVVARARAQNILIVKQPTGRHPTTAILATPDGVPMEVIQA